MEYLSLVTLAFAALFSAVFAGQLEYIAPGFSVEQVFVPENCTYRARKGDFMYQDYVGTLADGTKFDSSYDRGRPFTFNLGVREVIRGMDIAMRGMCKGEKRKVIIPPIMGYGSKQRSSIPPDSTLFFDIVLTDIRPSIFKIEVLYRPEHCTRESEVGDFIKQKYNGTFFNGTLFDTSRWRGGTFDYTLGEGDVILGVDMGMLNMCVGEKRRLTIPAILAYGRKGLGRMIPPNAPLMFEKELVEIVKGELKWTREKSPGCWTVDSTYWLDTVSIYYKIIAYGSEAEFSNRDEDKPFTFLLGDDKSGFVGLMEGMLGMCEGETRLMRIPPELAVGDINGEMLPQGIRLTAEVELVKLDQKETSRKVLMVNDEKNQYVAGSLFYKFFL